MVEQAAKPLARPVRVSFLMLYIVDDDLKGWSYMNIICFVEVCGTNTFKPIDLAKKRNFQTYRAGQSC